ncbi:hypothetical protein GWI33_007755 [Rhynchophorus ferrugineus]|uniref:Uncharacterized protein n=1 Tax=Rhynchophorus ferrugineus TaxID=354439 RepID=A0A834J2B5_RHYFE|nr:hypothetical protein GWI33_007755 [Rhynchophorus ferrugineus]
MPFVLRYKLSPAKASVKRFAFVMVATIFPKCVPPGERLNDDVFDQRTGNARKERVGAGKGGDDFSTVQAMDDKTSGSYLIALSFSD